MPELFQVKAGKGGQCAVLGKLRQHLHRSSANNPDANPMTPCVINPHHVLAVVMRPADFLRARSWCYSHVPQPENFASPQTQTSLKSLPALNSNAAASPAEH